LSLTARTRVAAVLGDPVRHSLSPAIMNAAFGEMGLDWAFVAFEVGSGGGAGALDAIRTLGLRGCSVTMPLKEEIADALDRLDPLAQALRAVNCVYRDDDGLAGANTDGAGFCAALADAGVPVADRRVAVLGAGGAARSVIAALAVAGAAEVVVVNRSQDRAVQAASLAPVARVGDADDLPGADIVVNATSVGMGDGALPCDPVRLGPQQVVADLVYEPIETPLLAAARLRGLATVDGVGMLVHQAALAIRLWTGRDAPIDVMTAAARRALADRTTEEIS
jgi:shikimate dehydrogenase